MVMTDFLGDSESCKFQVIEVYTVDASEILRTHDLVGKANSEFVQSKSCLQKGPEFHATLRHGFSSSCIFVPENAEFPGSSLRYGAKQLIL